ncbi:MAG TPA: ATP-dependent DNA ligase, partial [Steroidobacteraceae bacterium]|nr:ATP-dependent DNA ligase [Steroidobacteraceae bacterium]
MTLLADLVGTSQRVRATSSRLAKVRELVAFLRILSPDEVQIAVLYLSGETPQGHNGLGFANLRSAAAASTAASTASLSIASTDQALEAIAAIRGAGSAARRAQSLRDLLARATPDERQFLLPLLLGELRQGAQAGVMLDAIASAAALPAATLRRAAMHSRSLGAVARAALFDGPLALAKFQLQLFAPVAPMLAQTAADVGEALRELGDEVIFEWKMDGARIQLHKRGDEVRLYTRALNDVTAALPEIVEMARSLSPQELMLDGEAIAFDAMERPLPFQVTMRRFGRKLNVEELRHTLPIRAFFFDCLYINGHSIADGTTAERFRALEQAVPIALRVPRLVSSSEQAARNFYEAALAAGHEGVMAKSQQAPYEAGNRGASWLKIKRSHTLDLVVIAVEWGSGRRTGKLSNLHLGALDPVTGEYVMLGKTFKGLTDEMLAWQTRELLAREIRRDHYTVYVRPEL